MISPWLHELSATRAPPSHSQKPERPTPITASHGESAYASRGPSGVQPPVWRHATQRNAAAMVQTHGK
jgi:hypothetical protein